MEIELAMRTETDMDTNSIPDAFGRWVARFQLLIWELGDPLALVRARAAEDAY